MKVKISSQLDFDDIAKTIQSQIPKSLSCVFLPSNSKSKPDIFIVSDDNKKQKIRGTTEYLTLDEFLERLDMLKPAFPTSSRQKLPFSDE